MNIFESENYKQCLRSLMSVRQQQFGARFTFEKMALACGIQKTYLSKVLNSSTHLNPDQLFSACEYLKLNSFETEFILLLRDSEVALNPKRASLLKSTIAKIRNKNMKTESVIQADNDVFAESNKWEYYADIDLQLVHMFMTIPAYSKDPHLICSKIGIDTYRLQAILLKLQNWKLVQFRDGSYNVSDPKLHLPEDSPVFLTYGILNRIKTIEKIRQASLDKGADFFFSVIFSANKKLQSKFKRKFLDLVKELQDEVVNSKSEEIYQLNIDLFKWS